MAGRLPADQRGGLGFTFKWNMGWMHDTLDYVSHEPVHRRWHHDELTFSMMYAWDENFVLPLSHDEVVHGKGALLRKLPGDEWQQFATLRALYAHMWAHPGKQLLFMGGELGQGSEWSEAGSLDWYVLDYPLHRGVLRCVADLNRAYRAEPALWQVDFTPDGFQWLVGDAREDNVLAASRRRSVRPFSPPTARECSPAPRPRQPLAGRPPPLAVCRCRWDGALARGGFGTPTDAAEYGAVVGTRARRGHAARRWPEPMHGTLSVLRGRDPAAAGGGVKLAPGE